MITRVQAVTQSIQTCSRDFNMYWMRLQYTNWMHYKCLFYGSLLVLWRHQQQLLNYLCFFFSSLYFRWNVFTATNMISQCTAHIQRMYINTIPTSESNPKEWCKSILFKSRWSTVRIRSSNETLEPSYSLYWKKQTNKRTKNYQICFDQPSPLWFLHSVIWWYCMECTTSRSVYAERNQVHWITGKIVKWTKELEHCTGFGTNAKQNFFENSMYSKECSTTISDGEMGIRSMVDYATSHQHSTRICSWFNLQQLWSEPPEFIVIGLATIKHVQIAWWYRWMETTIVILAIR